MEMLGRMQVVAMIEETCVGCSGVSLHEDQVRRDVDSPLHCCERYVLVEVVWSVLVILVMLSLMVMMLMCCEVDVMIVMIS